MLPGIQGLELSERVPESDRLGDVTVTFMTGPEEGDLIEMVGDDVEYMGKPFSPSDMRERLRSTG